MSRPGHFVLLILGSLRTRQSEASAAGVAVVVYPAAGSEQQAEEQIGERERNRVSFRERSVLLLSEFPQQISLEVVFSLNDPQPAVRTPRERTLLAPPEIRCLATRPSVSC